MHIAQVQNDHRSNASHRARSLMLVILATVVAMVADGMTVREILDEHPDLEAEDIAECLRYAALAVQRVNISGDTDFGELLARSNAPGPLRGMGSSPGSTIGSPSAGKVRHTNISR